VSHDRTGGLVDQVDHDRLFSVDGMIVAASTTLLADSRSGGRDGALPWTLLAVGSVASLAANVAVAEPTVA
jgi:hypothetical protein